MKHSMIPRPHLVLIKMGGSLITDKTKPMTFQRGHVERIATELHDLQQTEAVNFLLGTGAGSFGHFSAHQYGLRSGAQTPEQLYGMCVTHNATQHLSSLVAEVFTDKQVGAFTLSPSAMITCQDKQVITVHLEPIQHVLAHGLVPIIHGDTVLDTARGTTILSTEKVFHECLKWLRPSYQKITLIYLMNIDGVLNEAGEVMSIVSEKDNIFVHSNHDHDVTGGMTTKLQSARAALAYADAVHIVNGKTPGIIRRILAGENVGTEVVA